MTVEGRQFYFVGGGFAALTGAALLLREYGAAGQRIHVPVSYTHLTLPTN